MVKDQTIVYEFRVRDQHIDAIRLKEVPVNSDVSGIITVDTEETVITYRATPSFTDTAK